ncbi:MAG: hypothetical protein P9L99_04000 [Candidatus Lernaella stagnicola]|nr:hypothetical protein [Candidatus Lernaella stagnicola]
MRQLNVILEDLKDRGILVGPGHFVLGDGYGNPGFHSRMFIHWGLFAEAVDIYAELVHHLAKQISHVHFDCIIATDEDSLPTARMLARVHSEEVCRPPVECFSRESGLPTAKKPQTALLHDDFINNGRQANDTLIVLAQTQCKPVAISTLFTRTEGLELFSLPIYSAVGEAMVAYPPDDLPVDLLATPINTQYGKGDIYLRREAEALAGGLRRAANSRLS